LKRPGAINRRTGGDRDDEWETLLGIETLSDGGGMEVTLVTMNGKPF
jgi:hypothetical protein